MCGIAGIVDFAGGAVDPQLLKAMTDEIHYRGPDDEGYLLINGCSGRHVAYCGPASPESLRASQPSIESARPAERFSIGLAHRRFSIIDLSAGGHQPLFSNDGSSCVVFNGEIYNYLELRDELADLGVVFHSRSDTEVLMEAYRVWGTECFSRFNGFWALALYDFREKRLILSRDRLGKKPLYWTRIDGRLFFASEIKSLLKVPDVAARRRVNEAAVWSWCMEGRRDLNYTTFFADIHTLPSACWTAVDDAFPRKHQIFWQVPGTRLKEREIGIPEACRLVRDSLDDAVRIRLRADVPLALELSGGLDSSTVLALAARHYKDRLTTYTVRFAEPQWNEEPYARAVASQYDVDYRVLDPDLGGFWRGITAFTYLHEEPYHSPNMQTSQLIWSMMRAEGTKVTVTGAAGDEMFAGYHPYYWKVQAENLLHGRLAHFLSNARNWTEQRHGWTPLLYELMLALRLKPTVGRVKRALPGLFKNRPIRNVDPPPQHHPATLSAWLREDITNTLIPYWLRSGEKNYMGIPFEARCPFLDYQVVEVATQLPITYLIRDGWHKWILRKAMEDILPPQVVWRRNKLGFPYPYERFFTTYRDVIDLILSSSNNPYLNDHKTEELRTNWTLLSFVLWYEFFINDNRDLFARIETMVGDREQAVDPGYNPVFHAKPLEPALQPGP